MTQPPIFHAAPGGKDLNNDCLDAALPCTPQGAYVQAMTNWDFAGKSCLIKLANGTYTVPPGEALMEMAGMPVGTHLCQVSGDVTPDFSSCNNPNSVIVDIPQGGQGFSNTDGIISVISCLTIRGANNAVGIWSQQSTALDIADIVCGPVPRCIEASTTPAVNINGPMWLGGDIETFLAAGNGTALKVWYQQVTPLRQLTISYWALAYGAGASIEFREASVPDSHLISGPTVCIPAWTGVIIAGGMAMPCTVTPVADGKFYP
jgi:hypothetical protein